jgi:hypothetical protein
LHTENQIGERSQRKSTAKIGNVSALFNKGGSNFQAVIIKKLGINAKIIDCQCIMQ